MSAAHITHLAKLVGKAHCRAMQLQSAHCAAGHRQGDAGHALAVVCPADTAQVSQVMRYCFEHGIAVVPQGGNSLLEGGTVAADPVQEQPWIALSLARMDQVVAVDAGNDTMVIQAGATIAMAREAARQAQRLLPMRSSSGSLCQIGSSLAANAAGVSVLHGSMRDLVLGLEVVLPTGKIWNGLRALRHDSSGYDLKQLFIGSAGTLGVITAAVLKLAPSPKSVYTDLLATPSPYAAMELLSFLKERLGEGLSAFELISAPAIALAKEFLRDEQPLLAQEHDWLVLVEVTSHLRRDEVERMCHGVLAQAYKHGLVKDALLDTTEADVQRLWRLVSEMPCAHAHAVGSVRCDVSLPLWAVPEFIDEVSARVLKLDPGIRMALHGHAADGSLHFAALPATGVSAQEFVAEHGAQIAGLVNDTAQSVDGLVSAVHGVATHDAILNVKSRVEVVACWSIKQALDPKNLLNPGKFPPDLAADFCENHE